MEAFEWMEYLLQGLTETKSIVSWSMVSTDTVRQQSSFHAGTPLITMFGLHKTGQRCCYVSDISMTP